MMDYAKLYKRTTTGAIQVWWQEREDDRYRTHSGQHNGAIVTSEWTVAAPKNVGRANATTASEQAEAEVGANYELKRKKGYVDTPETAAITNKFQPMTAKVFEDERKHVDKLLKAGPVYAQPKLDGMRCIARAEGLFSRNGNAIVSVPHVMEALKPHFEADPDLVLDGELYNHDLHDDFPALMSLVRKTKPTTEDTAASEVMQYWIYDIASHPGTFTERLAALPNYENETVRAVATVEVHDLRGIDAVFDDHVSRGYEGIMLRDPKNLYEQKRSKGLIKYKPEFDGEFTVLDIEEGVGNRAGMAGRVLIALPNGGVAKPNPIGDRDYLRRMLAAKEMLRGKQATVLHYGVTPDGSLRFPRVKVIHSQEKW